MDDEALHAAATPDLYRTNAFRVTGLPVDAPPTDVEPRPGPLPVTADADADADRVDAALQRLRNPDDRLVDTFFWFWPPAPGEDPDAGLSALVAGDEERAGAAWEAAGTIVARHNLAVLNHALALDDDHAGRPLPRHGAPLRWRRAYRHWLAVWRSDRFWDLFADRVVRLGHPDPGPSTAARFRDQLPAVLSSISVAVSMRCVERGLPEEAALVHWRLANYDGFPPGARADILARIVEPIAAGLLAAVDETVQAAQAARTAPHWTAAPRRLPEEVEPMVRILESFRPPGAEAMYDSVAERLMRSTLRYHEEVYDQDAALALLGMARRIARSGAVIREIDLSTDETRRTIYGPMSMIRELTPQEAAEADRRMRKRGR